MSDKKNSRLNSSIPLLNTKSIFQFELINWFHLVGTSVYIGQMDMTLETTETVAEVIEDVAEVVEKLWLIKLLMGFLKRESLRCCRVNGALCC